MHPITSILAWTALAERQQWSDKALSGDDMVNNIYSRHTVEPMFGS